MTPMLRVAIIDSNAVSRGLLSTLLIDGGYDVIGTSNTSPTGVARMVKLQPQVICIDIGHNDAEGDEALATMQTALPKALFFMVSGTLDENTVKNGAARGVLGFIVKPFNPNTVLATIRNTIVKLARAHQSKSSVS